MRRRAKRTGDEQIPGAVDQQVGNEKQVWVCGGSVWPMLRTKTLSCGTM